MDETFGIPYMFSFNDRVSHICENFVLFLGFLNTCTHDGENWPAKDYHKLDKQFLYVGTKNPDQDLYLNRSNKSHMCQFCKEQVR